MRIGDLAARTGVSVRAIRYYEEQGLLTSVRSPSGQRQYTDEQAERIRFIQMLYHAGISSRTIAELLPCVESPSADNSDAALDRMRRERDRLTEHIAELQRTRNSLDDLITAAATYRESLPVA
ncbi:MAG TPA: MerR family transcriptional regulator [Actinoplanes sp.]|nr:MerR family transcriptional regulator [Actinoplanes sp.]